MILACQNICKSFGDTDILRSVTFHIEERERLAIIGINGAGKTTLLKVITGETEPDSGQVFINSQTRLGYLSQNSNLNPGNTIWEALSSAKSYITDIEARMRELEKSMETADETSLSKIMETYNRLSTIYDRENGYAAESEITGVIRGLGFDTDDTRKIGELSGGQRMRVTLGYTLLLHPDILLLDEPTNHLDIASTRWLEGYLSSFPGAIIVVSHDRYFIDRVTTKIVELDNGVATTFNGSYSFYSKEKAKLRELRLRTYMKQQAEIQHEEAVITKLKQFNREKSIKRAESREKKLDKMEVMDKPTEVRSEMRLTLEPSAISGEDILTVEHLAKSFDTTTLFSDINIDIKRGEHVALIGANGTGKSTILKLINRMTAKSGGTITIGSRVRIGYYDQELSNLSPDKTLFEEISDRYPELTQTRIRNVLAGFLFTGDDVFKKIEDLSGGERGRLSLACLMLSPANFLLLDEPTNHLDIVSKEILEDALSAYTGTILFVSHDRYFIDKIATRILDLRDGDITSYTGNYHDYEEQLLASGQTTVSHISTSTPDSVITAAKNDYQAAKDMKAKERKRQNDIRKLEDEIDSLEQRHSAIDTEMSENPTDAALLGQLAAEQTEISERLETLYERWEELQ